MKPVIRINHISLQGYRGHSLLLKRWEIEDAPSVFQAVDKNRSHLEKWLPWVQSTRSVEDSVSFIKGSVEAFERRARFEYGIFLRPNCSNDKEEDGEELLNNDEDPEEESIVKTKTQMSFLKKKALLIGAVGIVRGSFLKGQLEIGYWLLKDMEGNGIVTMAVKALMDEARSSLENSKFVINVHFDNGKSRKIPERLGFVEGGFSENEITLNGVSSKMIVYHLE